MRVRTRTGTTVGRPPAEPHETAAADRDQEKKQKKKTRNEGEKTSQQQPRCYHGSSCMHCDTVMM